MYDILFLEVPEFLQAVLNVFHLPGVAATLPYTDDEGESKGEQCQGNDDPNTIAESIIDGRVESKF